MDINVVLRRNKSAYSGREGLEEVMCGQRWDIGEIQLQLTGAFQALGITHPHMGGCFEHHIQ